MRDRVRGFGTLFSSFLFGPALFQIPFVIPATGGLARWAWYVVPGLLMGTMFTAMRQRFRTEDLGAGVAGGYGAVLGLALVIHSIPQLMIVSGSRPVWQVHKAALFALLFIVSGVISFVFARVRAGSRGPAPRWLGGSFLDDYFAFVGDLFGCWFVLGAIGALVLQVIDREKFWTRMFGGLEGSALLVGIVAVPATIIVGLGIAAFYTGLGSDLGKEVRVLRKIFLDHPGLSAWIPYSEYDAIHLSLEFHRGLLRERTDSRVSKTAQKIAWGLGGAFGALWNASVVFTVGGKTYFGLLERSAYPLGWRNWLKLGFWTLFDALILWTACALAVWLSTKLRSADANKQTKSAFSN